MSPLGVSAGCRACGRKRSSSFGGSRASCIAVSEDRFPSSAWAISRVFDLVYKIHILIDAANLALLFRPAAVSCATWKEPDNIARSACAVPSSTSIIGRW